MKQVEKDSKVIVEFLKRNPGSTIYDMSHLLGISLGATHNVLHFIRNNTETFEVALLEDSGTYWLTQNISELAQYVSVNSIGYMKTRTTTMINMLDFFYRKSIPGTPEARILRRQLALATAAEIFEEVSI